MPISKTFTARMDPRSNPENWGGKEARQAQLGNAVSPLFNRARDGIVSTLRYGDAVDVYAQDGEWTLLCGVHDGYLGWARGAELREMGAGRRERVHNLATHIYPEPDIKTPPVLRLSLGSFVEAKGEAGEFVETQDGFVFAQHLAARGDVVDYAIQFLDTPYFWGGGSADGIDCSGLMQLCYSMVGIEIPRDTDQQESALRPIEREALRRGDMVFWKGHVGMMENEDIMIHATAFSMKTMREPFEMALARIGEASSFRSV